jgi:hypothetical protein
VACSRFCGAAWCGFPAPPRHLQHQHNHHAFPTSAFLGLRRCEVDIGGLVIRALERVGLAWNVVRVSLERQAAKQARRAQAAAA